MDWELILYSYLPCTIGIVLIYFICKFIAKKVNKLNSKYGFNKLLLVLSFIPYVALFIYACYELIYYPEDYSFFKKGFGTILWFIIFAPFFIASFSYQINCIVKWRKCKKQQKNNK